MSVLGFGCACVGVGFESGGKATRVCPPATRGCASTPCCKARTRPGRTSRRGPRSTLPRYAPLSFA
eukprot:15455007-Alexandrium_andersonii.AAC.1